jgi:AmmeMemoRadiSam system protein B
MRIREPVFAGRFYPGGAENCRKDVTEMLDGAVEAGPEVGEAIAGLVPHAGWVYSGQVAAAVFKALARRPAPHAVVLFGSVHQLRGREAAVFVSGRFETPLGPLPIDDRLADRMLGHTNLLTSDSYAHESEHSIEVQLPFIKHLFPDTKIVPIMVPPTEKAHEVGEAVGRTLEAYKYDAVVVGTTDLTHYGPGYGFTPRGVGEQAIAWAKTENDARFLDLVCAMKSGEVVGDAQAHRSACGSGAVAATIRAAAALGATRGHLLQHTTSAEVMRRASGAGADDAVGYAAVVFS